MLKCADANYRALVEFGSETEKFPLFKKCACTRDQTNQVSAKQKKGFNCKFYETRSVMYSDPIYMNTAAVHVGSFKRCMF